MKIKKLSKNKVGEKFSSALAVIVLSMGIFMFAFMGEESQITGFVVSESEAVPSLMEFKDVNALSTLGAGNYYIDSEGIVYWLDDETKPAIAKVNFVDEAQQNRHIYIDEQGRIGYVLGTFP